MIDEYREFCDYITLLKNNGKYESKENEYKYTIYHKDEKNKYTLESITKPRMARLIRILARGFIYPFKENDQFYFKNDFYNINKAYQKERLGYSLCAVIYLLTGEFNKKDFTEELFFRFINNDLSEIENGPELLEALKENKNNVVISPNELDTLKKRVYFMNRDAVIDGPLKTRYGVEFPFEYFKTIFDRANVVENLGKKEFKTHYNIARIAIMYISYFVFIRQMTHLEKFRFPTTTFQTWSLSDSIHNYTDHSEMQLTKLLDFDERTFENDNEESGNYVSEHEDYPVQAYLVSLKEEKNESYFYEKEGKEYFMFIDSGFDTFKNLNKVLKEKMKELEKEEKKQAKEAAKLAEKEAKLQAKMQEKAQAKLLTKATSKKKN